MNATPQRARRRLRSALAALSLLCALAPAAGATAQEPPDPAGSTSLPEPRPLPTDILMPVAAPTGSPAATAAPTARASSGPAAPEPSATVSSEEPASTKARFSPLVQASIHTFVWPYLFSALVGASVKGNSGDAKHTPWLLLPCFGPFIAAGFVEDLGGWGRPLLIADGVAQTLGATTLLIAALVPSRKPPEPQAARSGPTFHLGPGPGTGLSLSGSF